ncbi:MAG TPA: hypothetical protein VNO30_37040 [Kofleriaceae bacterium]|nr:hypothetical protein [Kofleriaceae bacterium]
MRAAAAAAVTAAAAAVAGLGGLGGLGACSSFQDEDIVLDLRVLAMRASAPEQVVDVDLGSPPQPLDLLAQLVPAEMCALVADPSRDQRIRWSMTLCILDSDQRCDSDATVKLASGIADDPDTAQPAPRMCGTVQPDGGLLAILLEAAEGDPLAALGGIEYGISFAAGGEGDDPALDQFAGKRMRVVPRIPAARSANTNPSLAQLEVSVAGGEPVVLPPGRCIEQAAPIELRPAQKMRITPIEPPGAREVYVVPRLDGEQQTFTESLTYQWLASVGSFSSGSTGGPRDLAGNPAPLFTDYRAPKAEDLSGPTDVSLWIIQRDERLGAAWYESCVRVVP